LPGDDLGQRWKPKPGKRHPKTFTRTDDRLPRATRRTENSVEAVVFLRATAHPLDRVARRLAEYTS
jgi:hypothetical protein